MAASEPRIVPFGEAAFLVQFGDVVDPVVNARVHALAGRVGADDTGVVGLGACVPAYASLLVPFDPSLVEAGVVARRLLELTAVDTEAAVGPDRDPIEIPVRYGGDAGADLGDVARRTGSSEADVVALHSDATYRVFMLGFAPGFAYLGPLPSALRLPRRDEPRLRVPAGSVAIAAAQTAVYPQATAGGWHLIGRTDVSLWDPDADRPARFEPGALVRFVPV